MMTQNSQHNYDDILTALRSLSDRCDGAVQRDGVGFNGVDAHFGNSLACQERLSFKQASIAHKMLRKYKGQLSANGIDYDKIDCPEEPQEKVITEQEAQEMIDLILKEDRWSDPEIVQTKNGLKQVKKSELPAGFWNYWKIHKERIKKTGISLSKHEGKWELCMWSDYKEETDTQLDLNFSGLELYPFQKKGVEFIEQKKGRALVADEMGLGKTIQALSWIKIHPELKPVVIVPPASLKLNWQKEIKKWIPDRDVRIVSGKQHLSLAGSDIIIINYDILTAHQETLINLKPKVLIMDECHYIKNSRAQRTKAVRNIAKHIPHIIALSGTPITSKPIEFFSTLNVLRKDIWKSHWKYAQSYCNPTHNGFGWDFSGASNIERLHKELTSTVMIRRLKKDVLKELPDKVRTVIPLEINNRAEYDLAEHDLEKWAREFEGVKNISALAIVEIEKLKQITIKGKIKACIEWIENYIETGKLVVGCSHHSTVDALMSHFKDVAVKLDGRDSATKKQNAVESFQEDPEIKLFIGNLKAAGQGLTLTASDSTCTIELGWTPGEHDQFEDRVHRIGQESESVNAYYLIADNTIENDIAQILDRKRKVLDAVLDGEETETESLLNELLEIYREK